MNAQIMLKKILTAVTIIFLLIVFFRLVRWLFFLALVALAIGFLYLRYEKQLKQWQKKRNTRNIKIK